MAGRATAAAAAPVAAVAVIAGVVSYAHLCALAARTHQGAVAAHLLPLSLDGLIVAGSAVLLAGSRLGWLAVVPGVVATLFGNVASMALYGPLSAVVASWPAISFITAVFVLERWLRSQAVTASRPGSGKFPDPGVSAPGPASAKFADPGALVPSESPASVNGRGGWSGSSPAW